jgi:serine/threonine protein kinase
MAAEQAGFKDFVTADLLGEGGMGRVYKARQISLDRWVALKVLPGAKDKHFVDRFMREARSAARLVHPNIVQIYTVDEAKGIPYYSMEYIEGEDLENILRVSSDPLLLEEVIEVLRSVTKALMMAMEHGIVHRDIKPANIMVTRMGLVKVMDFGLAKGLGADQGLTQAGLVVGTPTYMSPEQGASRSVDTRSDLYSLGCVLYYCLTGQPPFVADNVASLLYKHMFEMPEPPSVLNPHVDKDIERVCMRMLAKKQEERYQSPSDVLEELAQMTTNPARAEIMLAKRAAKAWHARRGIGPRPKTELAQQEPEPKGSTVVPDSGGRPSPAGFLSRQQPEAPVSPQPQPRQNAPASNGESAAAESGAASDQPVGAFEGRMPPRPSVEVAAMPTVMRMTPTEPFSPGMQEATNSTDTPPVQRIPKGLRDLNTPQPSTLPPLPESPSAPPMERGAAETAPASPPESLPAELRPNAMPSPRPSSSRPTSLENMSTVPPSLVPPPPPPPSATEPRGYGSGITTGSGIRRPLGRVDDAFVKLPDGRWSYRVEGGSCKYSEGLATNLNPVPPLDAEKLGDCLLCCNWNKRTGCALAMCQELEYVRRYKGLKLATEQSILWVGTQRFDRAIAVWEAYMKANPDDPEGYRELARVYDWPEYDGRDKRRAVVLLRRFAELARSGSKFSQVEIARAEERASSLLGTSLETKSSLISPSMGVAFHAFYRGAIVCFGYGVMTPELLVFARAGEVDPDTGIASSDMSGAYGRATTIFRRFKSENAKREEALNVRKELARLSSLGLEELANDPSRILVLPCDQMTGVDVTTDTAVNIRCLKIRSQQPHELLFSEGNYFKADQCHELLRRRLAGRTPPA